jgi:GNAT superfamily N-acetyltransferase
VAIECGPLEGRELPQAAALLARVFENDGIISHYLGGVRRRRYAAPAFFRTVLHEHMPYGSVFAAHEDGGLVGVAIWAPPEAADPPLGARVRAWLSLAEVHAMFPRATRRLLAGLGRLDSLHPTEPHWYLVFTGVDPDHQHKGIGRTLLSPTLAQADGDGVRCHLETPFRETHAFYGRLGFELVQTVDVFPGTRPMSVMSRAPRAVALQERS